jgi:hypothetical protein
MCGWKELERNLTQLAGIVILDACWVKDNAFLAERPEASSSLSHNGIRCLVTIFREMQ